MKTLRPTFAFLLLALAVGTAPLASQTPSVATTCDSTTIDGREPQYVMGAKSFLATLQAAVRAGDRQTIANAIHFPLRVNADRKSIYIRSRPSFRSRFDQLFPSPVQQAILSQPSTCLFGRDQGVMIGNGEVWFEQDNDGVFRIQSLNITRAKPTRR